MPVKNAFNIGDMVDVNAPWGYIEHGSVVAAARYLENVEAIIRNHAAGTYTGWAYQTDETQAAKPDHWIQERHMTPHNPDLMTWESMMDKIKLVDA